MRSEDTTVEQPSIDVLTSLGWQHVNCFHERFGRGASLGRETAAEVVLPERLRAALAKLNPGLPPDALALAIEELTRDRRAVSPAQANREVYRLLKDGVRVALPSGRRRVHETEHLVRVVDWQNPANNDFLLASQFWVAGDMNRYRADLVGFVNGLPLLFIELKAAHKRIEDAFDKNLADYKANIPQLFWYNGLVILSNGGQSRLGTITSGWEHFRQWPRINNEGEEGIISLETMLRGVCEPARFLDLVENFTVFSEEKELIKVAAKNHQYLGVNAAVDAYRQVEQNKGRLGVFWHTEGSGKSYSMIFFAQKILRKLPGNHTFIIITDRNDLDKQIHKKFAATGAVTEREHRVRAHSAEHLKRLLREDHRYIFTLIQKFRTDGAETFPELSARSDIIVITDEAHRSQYDVLAMNMRLALPNAAFIGFTGTPLMTGEEKTRAVFGDYVSIYNFKQSVDDHNTVRLYYENRVPEMQVTNEALNPDMQRLLDEAALDENKEQRVEREFAQQYQVITRDERLETIAEDIVAHFMGRGYMGKAMVVAIDRLTAVRMYDKVRIYWQRYLDRLRCESATAQPAEREILERRITYMAETDMAVVVSASQGEGELFRSRGLDIAPHRSRMEREDLDSKFKDAKDPFRIAFVCAMWMTGFDVESCSTIYLDKPMANHTLMQTIARANRVYKDKPNGLIVDYAGVFVNLQKALAIYGSGSGGGILPGDTPIADKSTLVDALREALDETESFLQELSIDVAACGQATGFQYVRLLEDAVDAILANDQRRATFMSLVSSVRGAFRSLLPDPAAAPYVPRIVRLNVIAEGVCAAEEGADIGPVMQRVGDLLDESVGIPGYVINPPRLRVSDMRAMPTGVVDLATLDVAELRKQFLLGCQNIEIARLRGAIGDKLERMARLNRTRLDYKQTFEEMIEAYNAGALNAQAVFDQLLAFAQDLNKEERRAIAEQLSEEELAIFDLLTRPSVTLNVKETASVKKVASTLLATLKKEKLVLDWRKRQVSRAAVRVCIAQALDKLPPAYGPELYRDKCDQVYQHVYESYFGEDTSIYSRPA